MVFSFTAVSGKVIVFGGCQQTGIHQRFQGGVCVAVAIPEKEKFRDAGLWTKANQEKEIKSV